MNIVTGDLITLALEGSFDVIIHGCNCFHTMGAGIAKSIAVEFPEALQADKITPKGDQAKLGTFSSTKITRSHHTFHIVNAYTQFQWRGRGRKADYIAIEQAFTAIAQTYPESRIGYPMIGAGLAGGDWHIISEIIARTLENHDHTLVTLVS